MASAPRAPLQRISHNTLQEQVYRNIRQSLIDGQFKPGEILTIRDLARQLGTSVMPVREALHKLTVERVFDVTPTRSVCVPVLSAEKFAEICEARMLLEGNMARLATQRATAEDIARIEAAGREFASARTTGDASQFLRRNREFHFAIYAAGNQATLMSLIEPLWVRCGPCTLALFEEIGLEQIRRGATSPHRKALEAIRARRAAEAEEAIVADIRATNERYQKHVGKLQARGGTASSPAAPTS
jgi:DNA-binding GntR family transcriptional regulator